jgi:hypothetical protein
MVDAIDVSIVVACYNESDHLKDNVKAIMESRGQTIINLSSSN